MHHTQLKMICLDALSRRDADAIHRMAPGSIKAADAEKKRQDEWAAGHGDRMKGINAAQPEWQKFEGEDVLRVGKSQYIAVPTTGKQNAANFVIIDINDRKDYVTSLKKSEVRSWLAQKAMSKD